MLIEKWRPSTGLIPWRVFGEFEDRERDFERIFGTLLLPAIWRRLPAEEKEWMPAIEMFEKEDKFVVKAELPGMKEEDVDVSVTDGTLTIKGERRAEDEVKEENYYRCERSYGSFFRSIGLPSIVDTGKIKAHYEDGILEIDLPKAAEVKPKKITVATKKKEKESK